MLERDKICYHKGCEVTSPLWSPTILAWAQGYSKKNSVPLRVEVGICLCVNHKKDFKPHDISEIEEILHRTTTMYKVQPVNLKSMEVELNPVLEFKE